MCVCMCVCTRVCVVGVSMCVYETKRKIWRRGWKRERVCFVYPQDNRQQLQSLESGLNQTLIFQQQSTPALHLRTYLLIHICQTSLTSFSLPFSPTFVSLTIHTCVYIYIYVYMYRYMYFISSECRCLVSASLSVYVCVSVDIWFNLQLVHLYGQ